MAEQADPPRGVVARIARTGALLGGLALLFVAGLTSVSVFSRWLTSQPVFRLLELCLATL